MNVADALTPGVAPAVHMVPVAIKTLQDSKHMHRAACHMPRLCPAATQCPEQKLPKLAMCATYLTTGVAGTSRPRVGSFCGAFPELQSSSPVCASDFHTVTERNKLVVCKQKCTV